MNPPVSIFNAQSTLGSSIPDKGVTLPQDTETDVKGERHGYFYIRYLYARAHETRLAVPTEKGQDYLSVRDNGRRLVFAVCDGVSGSFFGDLAAKYLGDHLVEWLWQVFPELGDDGKEIQRRLAEYLDGLAKNSDSLIRLPEIPASESEMVKRVLEKKKHEIGSESTFACGFIDVPDPNTHTPQGRLFCAWMGNTEVQIWKIGKDEEPIDIGAVWDDRYRWSTRHGALNGSPMVYAGTAEEISHLVVYTDGLNAARDKLGRFPSDDNLREQVARLDVSPKSDDISFLEISLGPWWWRLPDSGLGRPVIRTCEFADGKFRADWEPVPSAVRYNVVLRCESNKTEIPGEVGEESWETTVDDTVGKFIFSVRPIGQNGVLGSVAQWTVNFQNPKTDALAKVDSSAGNKRDSLKWIHDLFLGRGAISK